MFSSVRRGKQSAPLQLVEPNLMFCCRRCRISCSSELPLFCCKTVTLHSKAHVRAAKVKEAGKGATDLQQLLLNGDLQVDAAAFVPAHRPQLVFVEGEELGPGEDPQTFNCPAERTAQLVSIIFRYSR